MDRRLMTMEEVAEALRLPLSTLRHYRQHADGPPMFKIGRRLFAYEDEIVAWVEERRQGGTGWIA